MKELPTYQEWQELPGKSARKEILITLRRAFDDKDIRELWELKPQAWYNLLHRYEIGGKRVGAAPSAAVDDRPHRQDRESPVKTTASPSPRKKRTCSVEGCDEAHVAKGYCVKHYNQSKNKNAKPKQEEEPNTEEMKYVAEYPPSDRDWPRKNVFEAEYTVVKDTQQDQQPVEEAKELRSDDVEIPFPTIRGTSAQLRKQFEGVALFLEGLEGEEARFEIRLSTAKA